MIYAMRRTRRAFCKTPLLQTNIGVHHFRCTPMCLLGYACIARPAPCGIAAGVTGLCRVSDGFEFQTRHYANGLHTER